MTTGQRLNRIIICALLSLVLAMPAAAAQVGKKYDFKESSGLNVAANVAGFDVSAEATPLESIIGTVINLILSFVGVLLFVLLIYGGFTWMTAQGNQDKVNKAKKIVTNSIIGLVITLSAYAISYFVISRLI